MNPDRSKDPLHGITLEAMLEDLVARHGWPGLGARISIRCFTHDPSVPSSLKFLRRTPWARAAVEQLYLSDQRQAARKRERNRERAARRAHSAARSTAPSPESEAPDGSSLPPPPGAPNVPEPA